MAGISVQDKVALVSGSNRGIGKAITVELLENGASKVYAGARDVSSLADLKEKYGDRLVPLELDVTNEDHIAKAAEMATDTQILINNAGVLVMGNFTQGNVQDSLKQNLEVNVWGLVNLTDAFLPILQKQDEAALVCVSSVAGLANMPVGSTYSVSKAAVHSIIQGLRGELQGTNVLVSGVYPGPIDTDMAKDFPIDKTSPEVVGKNVVAGIEAGNEDIFPDPMSEQMGQTYSQDPKAVEKSMSGVN